VKLEVKNLREHMRELAEVRLHQTRLFVAQAHFDDVLAAKRNKAKPGSAVSH
jgi:hypothetical protein